MIDPDIGISSACFYPDETLDAVKRCLELGFRNIEIFMNSFSELEEPYLRELASVCRSEGARIVSLHPFTSGYEYMLFFSAYKKRAADSCEFYRRYFHAAAYLGAEYTVFHGDSLRAPFVGMDRYCEVYALLAETAISEGVTLAHENVSSARGGDPAFMRELRGRIGDISFVFDIKQALRAGHEPFEMIDAMGDRIRHVHINDWCYGNDGSREDGCRLPGSGDLDLSGIIARLESSGYTGRYMIEVYRKNFNVPEDIAASAERLRRLYPHFPRSGSGAEQSCR